MNLRLADHADAADLPGPIGPEVRRVIEEKIVTNVLSPGVRVSEQDLASLLGVSRQPIREALIRLAEAGLVRVLPQRGTLVTRISVARVNSARFLREAVECAVVRQAAEQASADAVAGMRRLIDAQAEAARAEKHAAFLALDDELHRAFAMCIGHGDVWRTLQSVKLHMDRVRYLSLSEATPLARLIAQHGAIVDAIAARDPDAADAMMRRHFGELLESLPRLIARMPGCFDTADAG